MNLATVLSELGTRLSSISGLQTYTFPPARVVPPAAAFWLERVAYHGTYTSSGLERLILTLRVGTANNDPESAWNQVATWASGSGVSSVKAVLESGTYTSFDIVTVEDAQFLPWTIGDFTLLAAQFTLDIAGSGV